MKVWIQNPFDNLPLEGFRKQRFWLMAEAFVAAGHEVVYWTSDFSHARKGLRRRCEDLNPGFGLRFVKTRPYRRNVGLDRVLSHRAYAKEWMRMARETDAGKRPDVIISSLPSLSAASAALTLGREFGAKTVVDVMDAWPETFERLAPRGLRGLARLLLTPFRRVARRIYREADLVTGVCARYRELTGRDDFHLAYHGVEIGADKVGAGSGLRDAIRIVYAGHIGRTYDLDTALKAVAENCDFRLEIAGNWTRPPEDRVTAHGYLGQGELHRLLCACDVGLVPMEADSWVGIPYKFCDYAKAGLPIVSSLGGESERFLRDCRCGVPYRAGDAASLAAAIRRAAGLERNASRLMCEQAFDAVKIYRDYVKRVEAVVV